MSKSSTNIAAAATVTPPVTVAPLEKTVATIAEVHDAHHQSLLLREALQSDKVRIGYFIGAGCPLGIFDEKGEKSLSHIPDVAGLTQEVRKQLEAADEARSEKLAPIWDSLHKSCTGGAVPVPNVEHLLSEIRTLCARRGTSAVDGISKEALVLLDKTICDLIADCVGKALPKHRCAYHRFASWVGGLHRIAPVELFTTNYHLLLEEAFEQQRIPHFDGFVGAREPFFDLASIEQDSIPGRWTRLWKLHGSVNWQKRDDGGVFRVAGTAEKGKAMIYPSHLKYDQSRRMPYLAMLDRLKAFFRAGSHSEGYGPPVLVVCGYSFCDEHLNEVLLDGLRGNRSAQCFVLSYSSLAASRPVVELAIGQPNMTVIAWDGAVVGTREGAYRVNDAIKSFDEPWMASESVDEVKAAGTTKVDKPRCRLGDFHYFALFLEHLCGGSRNENASTPS